ncbi:gp53-like domain-containing protein [Serratia proteamaculans]|uniref:gp53-like domain-containing protein n=1 Tax=Serratia proteamaculans TaxID=28151 RepID=UPI0021775549|nr:hypothetical protein [Serratia proteamaculans]CAI1643699.1 Uncharacterised protein [Serratia proteamaculans]
MQKVGSTTDTADVNGEWTNGNVAQGVPPTIINADILNTYQRELVNIVRESGMALDSNNDSQAIESLKSIFPLTSSFSSTKQSAGYQKLPGGLIIQWGTAGGISGDMAAAFPVTFPNGVFQVVVSMKDKTDGTVEGITLYTPIVSITNTQFVIRVVGSDMLGIVTASYIAIGY